MQRLVKVEMLLVLFGYWRLANRSTLQSRKEVGCNQPKLGSSLRLDDQPFDFHYASFFTIRALFLRMRAHLNKSYDSYTQLILSSNLVRRSNYLIATFLKQWYVLQPIFVEQNATFSIAWCTFVFRWGHFTEKQGLFCVPEQLQHLCDKILRI